MNNRTVDYLESESLVSDSKYAVYERVEWGHVDRNQEGSSHLSFSLNFGPFTSRISPLFDRDENGEDMKKSRYTEAGYGNWKKNIQLALE